MARKSWIENLVSTIPGIGALKINEIHKAWKNLLLSGREGNGLVTLYIGKNDIGDQLIISESQFSHEFGINNVGEMVIANKISLGYPLFYIKETLGLKEEVPLETVYSLLYRSASIVLEAQRLDIPNALLILETSYLSSSLTKMYQDFARLLKTDGNVNCLHKSLLQCRTNLYFGLFNNNLIV